MKRQFFVLLAALLVSSIGASSAFARRGGPTPVERGVFKSQKKLVGTIARIDKGLFKLEGANLRLHGPKRLKLTKLVRKIQMNVDKLAWQLKKGAASGLRPLVARDQRAQFQLIRMRVLLRGVKSELRRNPWRSQQLVAARIAQLKATNAQLRYTVLSTPFPRYNIKRVGVRFDRRAPRALH